MPILYRDNLIRGGRGRGLILIRRRSAVAVVATPSGPFAPDDLSGLALWLKADSLALANDAPVSSWTDSSGNARHAIQATSANQPVYKTGIVFAKPVVRFAANDFLQTPALDFTATAKLTIFLVGGNVTAGALYTVLETSALYTANSGAWRVNRDAANTMRVSAWTTGGGATGAQHVTTGVLTTVFKGYSAYVDTAMGATNGFPEGKATGWLNNGEMKGSFTNASGVTGNLGNHVLNIGARNGASEFLTGDLAEILIYDRKLTHRDRGRVDLYLRDKYDLYS